MDELLDGGGELRPRGWEDTTTLRAAATLNSQTALENPKWKQEESRSREGTFGWEKGSWKPASGAPTEPAAALPSILLARPGRRTPPEAQPQHLLRTWDIISGDALLPCPEWSLLAPSPWPFTSPVLAPAQPCRLGLQAGLSHWLTKSVSSVVSDSAAP